MLTPTLGAVSSTWGRGDDRTSPHALTRSQSQSLSLSLNSRADVDMMWWQEKAGAPYMYYVLSLELLLELTPPPFIA